MRAWLHEKGIEFEERDFFRDQFSESELKHLLHGRKPSEIFSWNSPSFKGLSLSGKALGDQQLVALMLQEPRLIRRPLLEVDERLIIGSTQKVLSVVFS